MLKPMPGMNRPDFVLRDRRRYNSMGNGLTWVLAGDQPYSNPSFFSFFFRLQVLTCVPKYSVGFFRWKRS